MPLRSSALMLCFLMSPSLAQAPDLATAQERVNQATERFRAKDFEGALKLLREAEAIAVTANDAGLASIRFNIARCLELLERWTDAEAAYRSYLDLPDESHRKQRAWTALQALEKRNYGGLDVTCTPDGARLEILGLKNAPGSCPATLEKVAPGKYRVTATASGHQPAIAEVEVKGGERARLSLELKPDPLAPPKVVPVRVAPPPAKTSVLPWVTMGAGVLVLGVGGFATVQAMDHSDTAESLPPGDERSGAVDDFETMRTLSYAGYGVGGALLAGGVVWLVLEGMDSEAKAHVAPGAVGFAW